MPSLDLLLSQLEEAKRQFGSNVSRTEKLLARLSKRRFPDADSLIRFHEALLFIRSHPQSPAAFEMAESLLSNFGQQVEELRASGADLTPLDYIEYSGIANTLISGTFSYDIVRFLVDRYPSRVDAYWSEPEHPERLGATMPRFLPLLYEDSLVEANIPYITWIDQATHGRRPLSWLIQRFEQLSLDIRQKAELYDSQNLYVQWSAPFRASRTGLRVAARQLFYHREPLIQRRDINLDDEVVQPSPPLRKLSLREGERLVIRHEKEEIQLTRENPLAVRPVSRR